MSKISVIVRRLWEKVIVLSAEKRWHKYIFPSYWHARFTKGDKPAGQKINYLTACPNRGAGIGHQMSNWHAGYWWSRYFGLSFAHTPFAQVSWERFLGYGEGEVSVSMLKQQGYKVVRIPMFDEYSNDELELTRKIINSYNDQKVVFFCEQDQHYYEHIGVVPFIREKFHKAYARKSDLTPFNLSHFNIAVHVRRGDIAMGQLNGDPNLTMRWLDNQYYEHVLEQVLSILHPEKEVHIYLFSQGKEEDFESFLQFPNTHLYLDLNPESTFLSFVYADLLITSKSSFSYKPALLNIDGTKICPRNFWHSYPEGKEWILADDNGNLTEEQLNNISCLR